LAGQTHMSPDGDLVKLARDKCGWSYSFNRTLEMAQGQMSVRYEWTGIVRVTDEGVISGTGTGFLRGSQGTCTYGDPPTEVPIDVTSSATFTFEFQGARAGDTLTIEHPATTADVVVEGSFAPCMEAGPLAEFVIETALRDPALLPPAVVADRVGRTTERRNGATSVTTLSPPPTPRPTPSPSSQPTIAGPSTP
ncbi:MAG TPA: hypothetical protein VMZ33_01785, partial [Candidatus Limnocylindrales bacterium]|nr:hypothetical protein [Candidatus Limnocylindrales bacterium]